ncbi:primase-polymerase (primpol)-like protein [Deinococcus sp. HSC-46F16]|uniref:hypothetical protein n=1 Tax=Deinococcus sp. HSC-46F16 TaxID=2910968 RepID=UPI00209D24E4|nr:hypothetical protein [Deinococcus sp. HSC-46F16]MCP2015931.1 primase-polymerase (primpol)-like protein [Deinococcus sp. HSC-46F16]
MNVPPLPARLREAQRFLPWRRVPRPNGKLGKVPQMYRGGELRPCDPLRPTSWLHLEDALALVRSGQADGIGIALDDALGVTGLDLDDCFSPSGELIPHAHAVLQPLGSGAYVERSPSGQGLHALVRGLVPGGWRRQPGVELISSGFLTVTGNVVQHAPDPWPDLTGVLGQWHRERTKSYLAARPALPGLSVSHEHLLQRARAAGSGPAFRALWDAEPDAAPSASEGDLRLLLMLLYWGGLG